MNNQFQDFSNRMIAKHKGFGQAFDSATYGISGTGVCRETGGTSIENHYIKNLYQIQNLTEENHLYHQNLRFVTNILEKKLEQRVVPSVEKLVEQDDTGRAAWRREADRSMKWQNGCTHW